MKQIFSFLDIGFIRLNFKIIMFKNKVMFIMFKNMEDQIENFGREL